MLVDERINSLNEDTIEKTIIIDNGHYVRISGEKTKKLTNFTIIPQKMVISESEIQMFAIFRTEKGHETTFTFSSMDFSSVRAFKAMLNKRSILYSYLGTDTDLEHLKAFIAELEWPEKQGVSVVGIHQYEKKRIFVCAEGAIDACGNATDMVILLDTPNAPRTSILQKREITQDDLRRILPALVTYNDVEKTLSILGWVAGCFLKFSLFEHGIKFPHLALIGEAGSGKSTTLSNIILPFFSTLQITAAPEITAFSVLKSTASTNLLPYALDEFKPSKIDNQKLNILLNLLRGAYDASSAQRGSPDQTLNDYQHLSPIVICGEESPAEPAIRERMLELLFMRGELKDDTHKSSYASVNQNTTLLNNLGYSLLLTSLQTSEDDCFSWYQDGQKQITENFPSRVINNLACAYSGLELLNALCASHGTSFEALTGYSLDMCLHYLQEAAKKYMFNGHTHNKNILDETFEIMARMHMDSSFWRIIRNSQSGCEELWMRINECYDAYTRYRRDCNISGEVLSAADFKKQLKASEIFITAGAQKRFGSTGNKKCWVLNFSLLQQRCDVSGFIEDIPLPYTKKAEDICVSS